MDEIINPELIGVLYGSYEAFAYGNKREKSFTVLNLVLHIIPKIVKLFKKKKHGNNGNH